MISMDKERQGPGQYHTDGHVLPPRNLYAGGFGSMGQAPRPNVKTDLGIVGRTSSFLLSKVEFMVQVRARGESRLKQTTSSSPRVNASVCSTSSSMSCTKVLLSFTKGLLTCTKR
ncbi:hypothetical protein CCR75_009534 [Bremia lactucae]|uniref:Uncharacterized protein n=1 Tax=Bremia lactucae TaxID=4779 RepID=A0A976IFQ7_BRELC|nr:hypothetical protein CCR75_009534 [Bremia lactucae]